MARRLAVCFLFVEFLLLPELPFAFRAVSVGDMAPATAVKDLGGREVKLAWSRRPVVLVFWRSNQAFSLEALKDLEQIKKEFSQKGLEVLAVAEGRESNSTVQAAIKSLNLSYPIYLDAERKAELGFGVIVFPSTGIVGADGRLKFYLPSRNSNYREILQARLKVEFGLMKESEFDQQMKRIGEELGSERARAEDHLKTGLRLSRQGKPREAVQELKQALSFDQQLLDAHLGLGYAYLNLGEPSSAQKEFELVLKQHPASPSARLGMGICAVRLGELDRGIEMLKDAVQINPDPVQGYFELGSAYEKKGDLKEAMHAYKWAVRKLLQGRR
ncbi:MAG: hypothetical protein A3F90_16655 [Deltaproteobacteria bacterium RIFCSPLOWO2_12_FULL_60_19]|nr:MAG: hypothetical protein A3F90_16655 [Deltaproteobacteria bacterium RIFCSPLOWO2_12_FULL_60_19]